MQADPDDILWLVSNEATKWLEIASQQKDASVAEVATLRKHLSPNRAHLVMQQADLRRRAAMKFSNAARMFFTPQGVQQATDQVVARYKADRFRIAETDWPLRVVDLCCGIGGDLMALAERGPTEGVELDPTTARFAAANSGVRVSCQNAQTVDLSAVDAWHVDPDRRPEGKRTIDVDSQQPSVETIDRFRAESLNGAIKLAPASQAPTDWAEQAELEWISSRRECRQQVVWFGELTDEAGRRRATVLRAGKVPRSLVGMADGDDARSIGGITLSSTTPIGRYLYEPDAALLAAGLIGTIAREYRIKTLGHDVVYLTGDEKIGDPLLATFEVTDVMPLRIKRIRSLLRDRGIGRLEVKKRAVPHDPQQLARQLQVPGRHRATLLVTRRDDRAIAILARRVTLDEG